MSAIAPGKSLGACVCLCAPALPSTPCSGGSKDIRFTLKNLSGLCAHCKNEENESGRGETQGEREGYMETGGQKDK